MPLGWKWYHHIKQKLIAVSNEVPECSFVLDVGCNSGEMGIFLKEVNKCRVVGFDISHHLVMRAKRKGIGVVCADAEFIPFKSVFDCVFLGEMIEHSYNPDAILEECKRILKPDGLLVGTTLDEELCLKKHGEWDDKRLHARPYGVKSMGELIGKHFKETKSYGVIDLNPEVKQMIPWIIFKGRG